MTYYIACDDDKAEKMTYIMLCPAHACTYMCMLHSLYIHTSKYNLYTESHNVLVENGNVHLSIYVLRLRKASGHELVNIFINRVGGSGLPEGGGGKVVIGGVSSCGDAV